MSAVLMCPESPGCGHAAAVRLLVAASASFDLTDEEGHTPLLLRLSSDSEG